MPSKVSTVTNRALEFTELPPEVIQCIIDNMLEMNPDLQDKDDQGVWEWNPYLEVEPKYNHLQRYQDALSLASTCKDLHGLLIKQIYRKDVRDNNSAALMIAAKQGNMAAATRSLDANADINAGDVTESVRFHILAHTIEGSSITPIKGGFRVPLDLKDQVTALHWAVWNDHKDIVSLLLSRGADVNHRVRIDTTEWSNRLGLVPSPSDYNVAQESILNQFPLRFCNRAVAWNACMTEAALEAVDPDSSVMVLEQGANPLYFAVQAGNWDMAELLIVAGADFNTHLGTGINALHQALSNCDLNMVRNLLDEGIDPNVEDPFGSTPLHFLQSYGGTKAADACRIVRVLADYGADINHWDTPGTTPLIQHLDLEPHESVVAELIKQGAHIHEGFHVALKHNGVEINGKIKKALEEHDNPDLRESMRPGWVVPWNTAHVTQLRAYQHFYKLVNPTDEIPEDISELEDWEEYWEKRPFACTWAPTLGGLLPPSMFGEDGEEESEETTEGEQVV
ncbi:hypothetical protein F53441_5152 [Fusarium austroafricanum]|uniref:Ankyrin repeat protein n=1 Tax=Fusarium austroafricanum TaxID=2364996 RepID=A0A8H4NZU7_9HYPO|nr:hypothetical protein F53441_5152 [Fusarium austroafricanum]